MSGAVFKYSFVSHIHNSDKTGFDVRGVFWACFPRAKYGYHNLCVIEYSEKMGMDLFLY